MKTNKIFAIILTLSMVIFASGSGISSNVNTFSGDNLKKSDNTDASGTKSEISVPSVTTDFSYLRFDVNDYITETAVEELPVNTFDYLRFDVNKFVNENETMEMELPAANEFDYLRFDVNDFIESNPVEMNELPVNEFDYLHFDVNAYSQAGSNLGELPITE